MQLKANNSKLRIAVIGPIFRDNNGSGGEGEKLYQKLKNEGFVVYKKSGYRNKLLRLIDTLFFIFFSTRKVDVFLIMIFGGQSFILESFAVLLAKLLGKKTIGVIHGGAFHEFYYRKTSFINYIFKQFSSLHTPSKFLQHIFWVRGHHVKYLPNFIELNRFFPPQQKRTNSFKIIWIRAIHEIYNPQLAIKTLRIVKNKFPNTTLTMIGPDKGELQNCIKLANELNLVDSVNFLGFIPNEELVHHLHDHDIFLNTTNYESFGVSLMEAASTGIPIVSTSVGEIPYIWGDNQNILLAPVDNPNILSQKIILLLKDENTRNNISNSARELTKQFEWEQIKTKWLKLLS